MATDKPKYNLNRIIKEYLYFRCGRGVLKLHIEELHDFQIPLNIIRGQQGVSIPKHPDVL
jgi:hypothetical protein